MPRAGIMDAMTTTNALLVGAEITLSFATLAGLFRLRRVLGIGLFTTALGTMHFLETYLAAVLYVDLPGGIVASPGSSALFVAKIALLLLVYVKEDAAAVRQPIYGLLAGGLLTLGLILILNHHVPVASQEREPDLSLMQEMGWLMVWGTIILYLDSIAIVLLYEKLGRWLGAPCFLRIWLSLALVLSFDQLAFYGGLRLVFQAPVDVLAGGWIAKMAAGFACTVLVMLYLHFAERSPAGEPAGLPLAGILGTLTYRTGEEVGRDVPTGLLARAALETHGRPTVDLAIASGHAVSLMLVDIDRFTDVDARLGPAAGDEALRLVGAAIRRETRDGDYLFRYGGDAFLVCSVGISAHDVLGLAERIRTGVRKAAPLGPRERVGLGIASGPVEAGDFAALLSVADGRLRQGKEMERTRLRVLGGCGDSRRLGPEAMPAQA